MSFYRLTSSVKASEKQGCFLQKKKKYTAIIFKYTLDYRFHNSVLTI